MRWLAPPLLMAALWSPASHAQDAANRGVRIVPSLSLEETVTDNRDLKAANPQADSITRVSPGIRIDSPTGRVRGSLAYVLNSLVYARDSKRNSQQNDLQANLSAEAIENRAFLDASATISQQTISAFGTQSSGTDLVNDNRTETSTLTLSPRLQGRLGDVAELTASLDWSRTHSDSTGLGDSLGRAANLALQGRRGFFGWRLSASRQVNSYKLGRTTTADQGVGTLSYYPDPELQLSINVGREAQDILSGVREWSGTSGWGANWRPTDRTQIAWQQDRTFYGHSHTISFSHRMARSVWNYSDTRAVSGGVGVGAKSQLVPLTLYDLFYNICLQSGGDPITCDQTVRAALAQQGLNPNANSGFGFLASGLTQQRSQNLSLAVSGLRTTITAAAFRTSTSPLDAGSATGGDLASVSLVQQQGYSLTVSQKLTPTSSLNASATTYKTLGTGAEAGNNQRLYSLTWIGNLGPHTNVSLGARHTVAESATNPYHESAIIGSLSLRY
jgi:uncharacterized protein (PEP-CTERM system associated)